ncbi:MAG: hypothetical protein FWE06_07925 [Oscillospiraceae bacterium]|nr:hypothetical protein [Oscillospiraceae bacterium]
MSRVESLSILLDTAGSDYLAELYGTVIDTVQKSTISSILKNKDLSGDPASGSVEAKRFANAKSEAYGTARAGGRGVSVTARPVVVLLDKDREIVEEIEEKDTLFYGVDGLLENRSLNHRKTMVRELERAFFAEAAEHATEVSSAFADIDAQLEQLIQTIENTRNDFVDGVDRDMISIVLDTATYGRLRNMLDTVYSANIDVGTPECGVFHGVKVFSSVYLPSGVQMLAMVDGSVAMPVLPRQYTAEKVPLSEAFAVSLFYYYGVAAVMPDLIAKVVAE